MKLAVEEARKCRDERRHDGPPPKVGAVAVVDSQDAGRAHRGESPHGSGDHAEFILLEKKLHDEKLAGATVFASLEPCSKRGKNKVPCARRLVERRVRKVYIGTLDPNPEIQGNGYRILRDARVEVEFFHPKFQEELEELNRDFFRRWPTPAGKQVAPLWRTQPFDELVLRLVLTDGDQPTVVVKAAAVGENVEIEELWFERNVRTRTEIDRGPRMAMDPPWCVEARKLTTKSFPLEMVVGGFTPNRVPPPETTLRVVAVDVFGRRHESAFADVREAWTATQRALYDREFAGVPLGAQPMIDFGWQPATPVDLDSEPELKELINQLSGLRRLRGHRRGR